MSFHPTNFSKLIGFRIPKIAAILLLLSLAGLPAVSAPPIPGSPQAEVAVTKDELEAKIEEIEATEALDATLKTKLVELYRQSLRHLETIRAHTAAAQVFAGTREAAPAQTEELRRSLDQQEATPITAEALNISEKTTLAELEQQLLKEQADLAALEAKLADVEKKLQEEKDRPKLVRERLIQVKQNQEEIANELKAPSPSDVPQSLSEARRLALQLQRQA